MRPSRRTKELLNKAKESCLLAVDVYNKPKTSFRSSAYIVLMTIAWTSLFHATFEKKKITYHYKKKDSNRYILIDGERKAWELKGCAKEYFKANLKDDEPIKKNIEFFIPLRNKIEHRFMPELDKVIFGECQSFLHNFETILEKEFGSKNAINEDLVFSLQFAKKIDKKQMGKNQDAAFQAIKNHIKKFRENLDENVFSDQRYSFKIYLLPKLISNQNRADFAINWVDYDANKPEEMKKYQHLIGFIKERVQPVSNIGLHKAGYVSEKVKGRLVEKYGELVKFGPATNHHKCIVYYKIRPKKGEPKDKTKKEYCIYDSAHEDYLYTDEWISFLINKLQDKTEFLKIFPNYKGLI